MKIEKKKSEKKKKSESSDENEKFHKKKIKNIDINVNVEKISICEWYSYNGRRCRRSCINDSEFCNFHNVLKEDFKILNKETLDCCVKRNIKLIPRNKNHIKAIMKKLQYDESDIVEIYLPGGSIEEGSIIEEDFIELDTDNSKYYYENVKGQSKAKQLRILLTEDCRETAVASVRDDNYCLECYIKKARKLGYPHLKLFGFNDEYLS